MNHLLEARRSCEDAPDCDAAENEHHREAFERVARLGRRDGQQHGTAQQHVGEHPAGHARTQKQASESQQQDKAR